MNVCNDASFGGDAFFVRETVRKCDNLVQSFGFADELRKKTSGAAVRESLMLKLIVGLKKYD